MPIGTYCRAAMTRLGETRKCRNCGKEFYVSPFRTKAPNEKKYCSNHCYRAFQWSPAETERRFWERVKVQDNGCWIWQGPVNVAGYGVLGIGRRIKSSHRMAWTYANGDPGVLCVLHRCDTPRCCNPAHLFLGTKKDNSQDMLAKGRGPHQRRSR